MNQHKAYYNLLMSGNDQAWTGTSWVMEYDRVFEYTHPQVKQQFEALDDAALQALQSLPTLFAYERYVEAPAHVGRITGISRRQREFEITFAFDTRVAPIQPATLMQLLPQLDIQERFEITRSHWAVKEVDIALVLQRAGLLPSGVLAALAPPPHVFISYSWDSPEHRTWVAHLATALRQNGVEVTLDQWHLRLGEDLAHFMARGVRESDRVLLICTEDYVNKARERQGGVGYEQMLVTGQLMREIGSMKFVPVVRQRTRPYVFPDELAGRVYVDLSDGPQSQTNFQQLVRDLHNIQVALPALGPRPF